MERIVIDGEGNKLELGSEVIAVRGSCTCRAYIYQIKHDKVLFTKNKIVAGVKPTYDGYSFLNSMHNKPNTVRAATLIKTIKDND